MGLWEAQGIKGAGERSLSTLRAQCSLIVWSKSLLALLPNIFEENLVPSVTAAPAQPLSCPGHGDVPETVF